MAKKVAKKVTDAVKSIFGDNQKEMTDKEQKEIAASIRGESEKLKNAILGLSFETKVSGDSEKTAGISKKQLWEYKEQLLLLCVKLDNARTTCTLDTRKMDDEMTKLCGHLQEAILEGNAQTVHYIVKALCYGIGKGHKPLLKDEEDKLEKVLRQREERLNTYVNICRQSVEMDEKKASINKNVKYMDNLLVKLKEQRDEVKLFKKRNKEAYKQIEQVGGRLSKLEGAALELAIKMKAATHTHKTIEQIKKETALSKGQIEFLMAAIDKLNIALNSHNIELKEELNDYIKQITESELERYVEEISWLSEFDTTLDGFYNSMEAAFNTPDLKGFVTKALQEYELMDEKCRREDEAYSRFLEEEHMEELEQDEEEMENVAYH